MREQGILHPHVISLNKETILQNYTSSFAFGAIVGEIIENNEHNTSLKWETENMGFYSKDHNPFDFEFEQINFHHEIKNKIADATRVIRSALFQSIIYYGYNVNEPLDFYHEPNLLVSNGFITDIDIHSFTNLKRIIEEKTLQSITEKKHKEYLWVQYSFDLKSITNETQELRFLLGWKMKVETNTSDTDTEESRWEDKLREIEELQRKLKEVDTNSSSLLPPNVQPNPNQTPTVRESSYTFKYTVDFEQNIGGSKRKAPVDMAITSPSFNLNSNSFIVDWTNGEPRSYGAETIRIDADSLTPLTIVAHSKRAKEYTWLNGKVAHSMNSLLKGLFGEMLLTTGIVPVERTINESGENGNEPYVGYITTPSLVRSIVQSPESYFKNEHQNIIHELEKYYRKLWKEDEREFTNILNNDNGFISGDIVKIPIDITMRYRLKGMFSSANKCRAVEGSWTLMYFFNVKNEDRQ